MREPLSSSQRVPAVLFGATILLSAFLLFQVQPLLAKLILPWFGGAAAVWTSCLLFFQVALLAGYAYAHWLSQQAGTRQAVIHLALLALSLLFLPILPAPWWKPAGGQDPLWRLLGLLAATAGLPYFLLSSTSPLLQAWYSRSPGGARPYRFFALSNAGAMAGLLTYPVLVEPYLTNRQQAWMWSISYGVFVLVCAVVAWRARGARREPPAAAAVGITAPPGLPDRLLWMVLAACASALLLSVTNHLTQNIAAIPFLWVLPLSLYLLSFILCFDSDRWYRRGLFACLAAVALPAVAYAIADSDNISAPAAITFFGATMFVLFMVCHGELARRRPRPAYLTSFYLLVSAGGATGGLFIGLTAPYLFNALYDLPLVLSLTSFLFLYLLWRERRPGRLLRPILLTIMGLLMAYCELLTERLGPPAILGAGLLALGVFWTSREGESIALYALAVGLAAGMAGYLAHNTWRSIGQSRVLARNFYGVLVVYDQESGGGMGPTRVLRSGTIEHGEQFLRPQHQRYPTAYYAGNSGVGLALQALMKRGAMNVGMIGLGAGTLTTYARPIDHYYIYEINPNVVKAAQTQFTFLQNCLGPYDLLLGDARLSLEREPSRQFDLLAVDAFSGDAIPVHLLSREAVGLYWRHLKPEGVLAVHVSNRYLSLGPVVALGALENHKRARLVPYRGADDKREAASDWVLVTSRPGFFELPEISVVARPIESIPGLRTWTDDYSNLYRVLR
jgi:SAM-dependent methyltransferase